MQNSTNLIPVDKFSRFFRKDIVSFTNILAHLSLGKPNTPELIAGIDMLSNPFCKSKLKTAIDRFAQFFVLIPLTHSWTYSMYDSFTW